MESYTPPERYPAGSGKAVAHSCQTAHFMRQWANVGATTTISGYNPLLEDFTNTSVFVGKKGMM